MAFVKVKDTGEWHHHKASWTVAIICNPRSGLCKKLFGSQFSLEDWRKIVNFYKEHEYFTIKFQDTEL
jgi:hypothetical protein